MGSRSIKDILLLTTDFKGAQVYKILTSQAFKDRFPNIETHSISETGTVDSIPPAILRQTKYIAGFRNIPLPEQVPNLEFVQLLSAGHNHVHNHPLWNSKLDEVKWSSASGVHGPVIGEYCVLAILAHKHRYLSSIHTLQGAGRWPEWPDNIKPVDELYGQTVGIVGYGAIGRNLARLLSAFHVNIITLNSSSKTTSALRRQVDSYTVPGTGDESGELPSAWYSVAIPEEKEKFFQQSDVVVITAPSVPATKHLVDAIALGHMKKTALIVNISRGELIDQDALIKALKNHDIAGAALDVFTPEPYPADGPLLKDFNLEEDRDRLLLTPHLSGHTKQYAQRVVEILELNLTRLENGKEPVNFINRRKGFN
jgi:phosphoglycerate dehydrogenase-like enzyme